MEVDWRSTKRVASYLVRTWSLLISRESLGPVTLRRPGLEELKVERGRIQDTVMSFDLADQEFFPSYVLPCCAPSCLHLSPIKLDATNTPDVAKNKKVILGHKLGLLEGVRSFVLCPSVFYLFPFFLVLESCSDSDSHRVYVTQHVRSLNFYSVTYPGPCPQIDPNPVNAVAAGVLHMSSAGKVGCLLRLEPNKDAKLCRLTIRSTNDE